MPGNSFSFLLRGSFTDLETELFEGLKNGREEMGGRAPDLVLVFVTPDWEPHLADLAEVIQIGGHAPAVAGASADGLIGRGVEEEESSGCTLVGIALPEGGRIKVEEIVDWENLPGQLEDPGGWILLADPFRLDPNVWSDRWNLAHRGVKTFGGLASGGREPGSLFLIGEKGKLDGAAIAVGLEGIDLFGVVSQGCRPIGRPYTITGAEGNIVSGIGSQPAFEVLEEAFESLEETDKQAAQGNILAGLAMTEYLDHFEQGDFLVRSILGGDREAGALALAATPQVGQTLQFQLRDAESAHTDLHGLLETASRIFVGDQAPFSALLFSCTGRGEHLFGEKHHDAQSVEEAFPGLEMSGFFCNGEIGPVGGEVHLHGFTASLALMMERKESRS